MKPILLLVCILAVASLYATGAVPSTLGQASVSVSSFLTTLNVTLTHTFNTTVTRSGTTTEFSTTTQMTSTTSTSTSVSTFLASTTITIPSLVVSTSTLSTTQTSIASLTTTTTQTTNALALVWGGKDYSVLLWIGVFAVVCIAVVVILKLSGSKGEKKPWDLNKP